MGAPCPPIERRAPTRCSQPVGRRYQSQNGLDGRPADIKPVASLCSGGAATGWKGAYPKRESAVTLVRIGLPWVRYFAMSPNIRSVPDGIGLAYGAQGHCRRQL